jgi:hypothetical protein
MALQVHLTDDDQSLLQEILEQAMADLREEVYKTDTATYREALRERESHLAALLNQIRTGAR